MNSPPTQWCPWCKAAGQTQAMVWVRVVVGGLKLRADVQNLDPPIEEPYWKATCGADVCAWSRIDTWSSPSTKKQKWIESLTDKDARRAWRLLRRRMRESREQ